MSEDVSAFIRIGITVAIMSSLVILVAEITFIAVSSFNEIKAKTNLIVATSIQADTDAILDESKISAGQAYKLLIQRKEEILWLNVSLEGSSASVTYDALADNAEEQYENMRTYLIKNSSYNMLMTQESTYHGGNKMYKIVLKGVTY